MKVDFYEHVSAPMGAYTSSKWVDAYISLDAHDTISLVSGVCNIFHASGLHVHSHLHLQWWIQRGAQQAHTSLNFNWLCFLYPILYQNAYNKAQIAGELKSLPYEGLVLCSHVCAHIIFSTPLNQSSGFTQAGLRDI